MVLTETEHHSNIVPWQLLCSDRGAELAYVPMLDDGQLDLEALDRLLDRSPKLVAVVHVSNVVGTINPIEEIVRDPVESVAQEGETYVRRLPRPPAST